MQRRGRAALGISGANDGGGDGAGGEADSDNDAPLGGVVGVDEDGLGGLRTRRSESASVTVILSRNQHQSPPPPVTSIQSQVPLSLVPVSCFGLRLRLAGRRVSFLVSCYNRHSANGARDSSRRELPATSLCAPIARECWRETHSTCFKLLVTRITVKWGHARADSLASLRKAVCGSGGATAGHTLMAPMAKRAIWPACLSSCFSIRLVTAR